MAIQLREKGAKLAGLDVPGFTVLTGLSPAQEAALVQGGDAVALGPDMGLVPAFFAVANGQQRLLRPDGSEFQAGIGGGLAPLVLTANTVLDYATVGSNRLCISQGAGLQHTVGTGWPVGQAVVIARAQGAGNEFTLVGGANTLNVGAGMSSSSASAQAGYVMAECLAAGYFECTSAAVGGSASPVSRPLLAATAVAANGNLVAVGTTDPKTVECRVAATGSGSIVAVFNIFGSFDGGATERLLDTLIVTGADQAGANRSITLNSQFTHLRVNLDSLTTTGVTAVAASALGVW